MTDATAIEIANAITTFPSEQGFTGVRFTHLELKVDRVEHFESERDAIGIFQATGMHRSPQESFWVLGYGPMLNVATVFEVNRGMYAYVELHLPSLIGGLLAAGCERFWLAHNHPSLDPRPSPADIDLTKQVMAAANIVKLHFEDHLILTANDMSASMARLGLLVPDPASPYLRDTTKAANRRKKAPHDDDDLASSY